MSSACTRDCASSTGASLVLNTSICSSASTDHGDHDGTGVLDGALVLARPRGVREYDDPHRDAPPEKYEFATWTSAEVSPGFGFTELVPSWQGATPGGSYIKVEVRGRNMDRDDQGRFMSDDDDNRGGRGRSSRSTPPTTGSAT